jgi:hypothetical protein
MEFFDRDDYLLLLDDMAQAGMDSVVFVIRWNTTGYRSSLPFNDQIPNNPVIASDNELLRFAIDEAHKRNIKVRLSGCAMRFDPKTYGGKPVRVCEMDIPGYGPLEVGHYDADHPGFAERAAMLFAEMYELFPQMDGLVVELEDTGVEAPHRVPLYNKWAQENGRAPIDRIGRPFSPRCFNVGEWRDYATYSRLKVLKTIENSLRSAGFTGDLGMICETEATDSAVGQEVNLRAYHREMPDWFAVTYEYDKSRHRYSIMDFCVSWPQRDGLKAFYLPRGVMTWMPGGADRKLDLPVPLEESWRMDAEDIVQFKPDGVWWFGCGTRNDGCHVSESLLRRMGYSDGVTARRALLKTVSEIIGRTA